MIKDIVGVQVVNYEINSKRKALKTQQKGGFGESRKIVMRVKKNCNWAKTGDVC